MTPEELAAEFLLGPDSLPQPGVPQGRLEKFTWATSRVFSGTVRDCWIYVPVQYEAAKPACVLVVQDGEAHWQPERRWRIPTILDNLIHQGAIPVMIGIFINPGVIPAPLPRAAGRNNRSFEYDSPGDRYARFLLDEILPEVGRRYALAQDGNSRAIMGGSSGAFCAFNAAWERPDGFARVLSIVGSYTAMRGGHTLPPLVRVTEPKPLRVFLESGADDLKVFCGDWWSANQEMLAALEYAGYEVNHSWAEHAGHNDFHGSAIFPDALRWLWQDYPRSIQAGVNSRQALARVTVPGEAWELVAGEYMSATALTSAPGGEVFVLSPFENNVYRLDGSGPAELFASGIDDAQQLGCGPDGGLYACQPSLRQVLACDKNGRTRIWLTDIDAHGVAFAANGNGYVTDPIKRCVWLITPSGDRRLVVRDLGSPAGVRLLPDQSQLIVTDSIGLVAHLFTVLPDGGLANGAPFFPLVRPGDEATGPTSGGLAVSIHGWAVFATETGLKIADRNGLIAGIIYPRWGKRADGVALGGTDQSRLYMTDGRCLYRRKIRNAEDLWC
jgi:enterochelin esterase-like enzyme